VVATELVPGGRKVTFANGAVIEEPIVDVSDERRRIAWTVKAGQAGLTHYNGVAQVFPREGGGSRIVWSVDLLPHEAAPLVEQMMEQGAAAMTKALNASRQAATSRL
jgi:hypothetical protein